MNGYGQFGAVILVVSTIVAVSTFNRVYINAFMYSYVVSFVGVVNFVVTLFKLTTCSPFRLHVWHFGQCRSVFWSHFQLCLHAFTCWQVF